MLGLETDLIIPPDRRTCVVRLISNPTRFVSRLTFQYPADDRAKWATFQAQQDAATRDAEAVAERKRAQDQAKDKQAGVLPMSENALDNLYFDYKLSGDPAYRPERVLDDGQHTYLIYPNDGRFGQAQRTRSRDLSPARPRTHRRPPNQQDQRTPAVEPTA
jgi:type IV secretory pathway VirB9-like protein